MLNRFATFWKSGGGAPALPSFVQVGTGRDAAAGASHTLGYACAVSPGANRLLCLAIETSINTDPTAWDAITYNGVAMSPAHFIRNTGTSPDILVALYYLLHADIPNDGASHDFVWDFDGAATAVGMGVPFEYINVAQGAPHRTDQQTGSTNAPSIDLTTVATNSLLVNVVGSANSTNTATEGASQNERYDDQGFNRSLAVNDKLPADHAGGTVTMAMSMAQTTNLSHIAVAWEPAA